MEGPAGRGDKLHLCSARARTRVETNPREFKESQSPSLPSGSRAPRPPEARSGEQPEPKPRDPHNVHQAPAPGLQQLPASAPSRPTPAPPLTSACSLGAASRRQAPRGVPVTTLPACLPPSTARCGGAERCAASPARRERQPGDAACEPRCRLRPPARRWRGRGSWRGRVRGGGGEVDGGTHGASLPATGCFSNPRA